MNVPKPKLPESIEERECHIYGISGWFAQPHLYDTAFAFGGYFRHDVLEKLVLDGQLIDCFGPSSIEGRMDEDSLKFVKTYTYRGPGHEILYEFKKEKGIWIGNYYGRSTGTGDVKCTTFLAENDGFYIGCGEPRMSPPNVDELLSRLSTLGVQKTPDKEEELPFSTR